MSTKFTFSFLAKVVFLDTDLELHRFPKLFMPGSWPDYPRDVALFNCAPHPSKRAHAAAARENT